MKMTTTLLTLPLLFACSILCSCDDAGASGEGKTSAKDKAEAIAVAASQSKRATKLGMNHWKLESAKIEFRFTGVFEGTEVHHFDKHGDTYVITTDRTEFGNKVKQTSFWNENKTTIYKHDDPSKKAWQGRMRVRETEPRASARLSQKQLESVGYERLDDEVIAGKTCVVYENKKIKVKIWVWNGIELKEINRSLGSGYTREAVSIETGVAVPASALKLPSGYRIGR